MGAGMTATLPPASLRVGAVGGIFVVSDETKRPDEAAMRRILDRYSDSPEGIILRLAWLEGLSREEIVGIVRAGGITGMAREQTEDYLAQIRALLAENAGDMETPTGAEVTV